jgi:hypothetical protein
MVNGSSFHAIHPIRGARKRRTLELLGTISAALSACGVAACTNPETVPSTPALAGFEQGSTITSIDPVEPLAGAICPSADGGLQVTTTWSRLREQFKGVDRVAASPTVTARFSSHWAETRGLWLDVVDPMAEVQASVEFDTDYGLVAGQVLGAQSTIHVHEDRVCFDLTVKRLEGSGGLEHWVGAVPLAPSE